MKLDPVPAELFGGRHVVHLTALGVDGSPQSRPPWTILHDGRVVFSTQPARPKPPST